MATPSSERITATYLVETPLAVRDAAEALAGEQSSGTFVKVPGETAQLRRRFAARVENINELETKRQPSLPGSSAARGKFRRAEVVISWSMENMGYNLPTLVSTIQGNLYELRQFSGLKLMDLSLPASFVRRFKGPRFGIEGTRRLTDVRWRPLIGTIIKPSIGLKPQQTGALVKELAAAGIDFIKDDELMADLSCKIFKSAPFVPLLVGAPALDRHCVFGNLFARAGKDGEPLRLDRHPTMSRRSRLRTKAI